MWVSTHNRSPELERGGAAPPVPMTTSSKVFFSYVPFDVGEEQLQMLFSEVARTIRRWEVMKPWALVGM
jgi:hypothetical protein